MKRLVLLAFMALIPMIGDAQTRVDRITMLVAYDLDGEAADADQIVTAANGDLTDAKTFTLTADPDVCRLVDMTVTDANSSLSAGVLTVEGVGCLNDTKSCSFTFAAGGSGVKTLTCTDGLGAYFSDVTSVTTGTLTGEGGAGVDLMTLGYTSNSVNGWAGYGKLNPTGPNGERSVDVHGSFDVPYPITTSASSSTTVTGVNGAQDAFAQVSVGDLLLIQTGGVAYERKVTAKASADSITVHAAITIPSAGVAYRYKRLYYTTNPAQWIAFPVSGHRTALVDWSVDANANTGGIVVNLECTADRAEFPTARWVLLCQTDGCTETATVASGSSQGNTSESVDLSLLPYAYCRFGTYFGTGDDADAAPEDINLAVTLIR